MCNNIMKIGDANVKAAQTSKGLWNFEVSHSGNSLMDSLEIVHAGCLRAMEIREELNKKLVDEEKKTKN